MGSPEMLGHKRGGRRELDAGEPMAGPQGSGASWRVQLRAQLGGMDLAEQQRLVAPACEATGPQTAVQLTEDSSGPQVGERVGSGRERAYHRDPSRHQTGDRFAGKTAEQLVRDRKNWNTVKREVLEGAQRNEAFMQQCCDFREHHVLGIVNQLIGTGTFPGLTFEDSGSSTVESDFDLTFHGEHAIRAVISFNKMFRETRAWGVESGTALDTNVYARNFLHAVAEGGGQRLPINDPEAQQLDDYIQDVASLVKIRKNMTAEQWREHRNAILAGITDANSRSATVDAYDNAEQVYLGWVSELYQEIVSLLPATSTLTQGKTPQQVVEEALHGDTGMAAANRLYEQKLRDVQALQRERAAAVNAGDAARAEALVAEIRTAHSEALLFANEPYFAEGTILDIVGRLGNELSRDQLFQSFNENFGDILKDIREYSSQPFGKLAYRSSKYVDRFLTAGRALRDRFNCTLPGEAGRLAPVIGKLLKIRKGEPVPTDSGVRETASLEPDERNTLAQSIARDVFRSGADLQQMVSTINTSVNTQIRGAPAT